ncbi:hypothetical protein A2U01_0118302, partial [Trifolium medium]|nr:hypothetical protein [Trifolium medium]
MAAFATTATVTESATANDNDLKAWDLDFVKVDQ